MMEYQADYIVTQCYGNEGVFVECAYALLSLSRLYTAAELAHTQVWIYTDNPEWFQQFRECTLQLQFRTIDAAQIKEWRGRIDFLHRVKIELLKDFTKDRNGNILYIDTDVVFTHHLDPMLDSICNGKLYMHTDEGKVSDKANPMMAKLDHHLRENSLLKVNDKPVYDLHMWNAGALGFNTKYRYLLDEVLSFTDSEYPTFPKHIIEQFAFSVLFQQTCDIKSAAPYLVHYWNLKEARQVLASFFAHFKNCTWQELAQYATLIQIPVMMQEKINFILNLGISDKLMKKHWQPAIPDWNALASQL